MIFILTSEVAMPNGVISSLGEGGGTASGSGAGGSIRVEGENISLGQALVAGGIRNVAGGNGSSYAIYRGTLTSGVFGSELDLDAPAATPGPTPTPTAAPTLNPASAVWHTRGYNYANAHPNRVTGTSDMDTYTYDENGNQVTRLVDGTTWTLAYNAENRLGNVSDGNGVSEAYLYDGDGVRVARVRSGEATYLFMGGLFEVTLALPAESVTGSKSYYSVEGQMLAMSDGSTTQYLLTDHLGSVVGVVDGSGALVSEQRYLPFGEARTDLTGITATDLSFTGQRDLTGTGLLDYRARQYDPSLRTFIQTDSIIPNPYSVQDYNRYLYVHANPVRFTDPSGNRVTEGCGDQGLDSCGATQAEIDRNIQAANEFRQTTERNQCKAGEKIHCSYAENHPVETILSGGGLLLFAIGGEVFILGGGAAETIGIAQSILDNLVSRTLITCLSNPNCQQLLPKVYDSRVESQTDKFHNFPRLLDSYIMKYGEISFNKPYVNYSIDGIIGSGLDQTEGIYQIGIVLRGWIPTIVHHFFKKY